MDVKIKTVNEIFDMKQAEIARAERVLANKTPKDKILAIIEDKKNQELSEKSIDELKQTYQNWNRIIFKLFNLLVTNYF